MTHLAFAYLNKGELEQALDWARSAVRSQTDFVEAPIALATILAYSDKEQEARAILAQHGIQNINPVEKRPFWRRYLHPTTKMLVLEGLCKVKLDT